MIKHKENRVIYYFASQDHLDDALSRKTEAAPYWSLLTMCLLAYDQDSKKILKSRYDVQNIFESYLENIVK